MTRPIAGRALQIGFLIVWIFSLGSAVGRANSSDQQSAQNPPPVSTQANSGNANAPEMTTHEAPVPLRVRVSLVPVRAVVRDAEGNIVGNLHREDFEIFEDGKPQEISNFLVENLPSTAAAAAPAVPATAASPIEAPNQGHPASFAVPGRFVALLFDDVHLSVQDLTLAKVAAGRYLDASVTATDRVALLTISGTADVDFTDDRAKLHSALGSLVPRDINKHATAQNDCPPMDYYEADLIQNMHDQQTTDIAAQDALNCLATASDLLAQQQSGTVQQSTMARAQAAVLTTATRVEEEGAEETEAAFRRLREIVQRMSGLPGQKTIVFISPGFIYPNAQSEFSDIIDRAIRYSVFVNTLDARGLYTLDLGDDISKSSQGLDPATSGFRVSWRLAGQERQGDLLMSLADDTGGYSFRSNNDLGEGLRRVVAAPSVYYYLAFSPQNLKYDGRLHSIKVTLRSNGKYTVQARRGFYAPLHADTPADIERRNIEDAVFSQEEQHGLPVALQTQFYKTDPADAKLAVLAHVDLAHLRFDKADGRNQNDLTIVAALFDRNGNFVTGTQRIVQMNLRDETLAKLSKTGVTVRTNFDVKPGDYVVRLVVRDSRAEQLSAENGIVQIPY